ncbi:MAG TPA: FAD-dependent oxidoreductase [Baekduia sp.]|nr:FAD-dependent oxidoreductase [Baekduia sp.]HMJ32693.1 FAD-dependent oxidoreductase [Baekduia sp.]
MRLEVAVVGGGVVGVACALAFARRGAAVTLLESAW